jgi:hypothetical protein
MNLFSLLGAKNFLKIFTGHGRVHLNPFGQTTTVRPLAVDGIQ